MTNEERITGMSAQVQTDLDKARRRLDHYRLQVKNFEQYARETMESINRDKALAYKHNLDVK